MIPGFGDSCVSNVTPNSEFINSLSERIDQSFVVITKHNPRKEMRPNITARRRTMTHPNVETYRAVTVQVRCYPRCYGFLLIAHCCFHTLTCCLISLKVFRVFQHIAKFVHTYH